MNKLTLSLMMTLFPTIAWSADCEDHSTIASTGSLTCDGGGTNAICTIDANDNITCDLRNNSGSGTSALTGWSDETNQDHHYFTGTDEAGNSFGCACDYRSGGGMYFINIFGTDQNDTITLSGTAGELSDDLPGVTGEGPIAVKVEGEDGDDTIYGSTDAASYKENLFGEAGADTIYGYAGADYINGGTGGDTLDGGEGNDEIYGASGEDTIVGDAGQDYIRPGADVDDASGGDGNDIICDVDTTQDYLYGDDGDDTILGDYVDPGTKDYVDGGNEVHGDNCNDHTVGAPWVIDCENAASVCPAP